MKTVFKVGMKVYDRVVFPDKEGMVVNIVEKDAFPIKVDSEGIGVTHSYTKDGRIIEKLSPTLSTSSYTFQGFEQKEPAPTFKEAQQWMLDQKGKNSFLGEPNEIDKNFTDYSHYEAFEALKKLIILRDYYNEGWQPDWREDSKVVKFCIEVYKNDFNKIELFHTLHVLAFRTKEIRDKFLEEQKELLEIAKPLI